MKLIKTPLGTFNLRKYRLFFRRNKEIILLILALLLFLIASSGEYNTIQSVSVAENTPTPTILPANDTLSIINVYRNRQNLPALQEHHLLTTGAMKRAKDLIETGQWSHDGFVSAFLDKGHRPKHDVENLARDFPDNISVVEAWHVSKGHADIMYDDYTHAGVGMYENYFVLWVGSK